MSTKPLTETSSPPRRLPAAVNDHSVDVEPGDVRSDEQIVEIVDRLERRYPRERISRSELDRRARRFYHQFDSARIRTFVAVFVERLVRTSVEQPA